MPIRILIADDHAVVRTGIRALLGGKPDLEVVGEAADSREALRLTDALHPDLMLLDITMPPEDGIRTTRRLREKHPGLAVVILTMHDDEDMLRGALHAGAAGYVVKNAEESEIIRAIHAASRGDLYVPPEMARALLDKHVATEKRRGMPAFELTPREIDVLRLLAKGNTNRQISNLLGISVRTVENHRANLMGKLGLSSRVALVRYAEENDLLD